MRDQTIRLNPVHVPPTTHHHPFIMMRIISVASAMVVVASATKRTYVSELWDQKTTEANGKNFYQLYDVGFFFPKLVNGIQLFLPAGSLGLGALRWCMAITMRLHGNVHGSVRRRVVPKPVGVGQQSTPRMQYEVQYSDPRLTHVAARALGAVSRRVSFPQAILHTMQHAGVAHQSESSALTHREPHIEHVF